MGSDLCRAACRPVCHPHAEGRYAPGVAAPSAIDRFFSSSAGAAAISSVCDFTSRELGQANSAPRPA
jgi:hypothetical protein